MSELKMISPLLDHFLVGDAISCHDGVRCYPAMREYSDEKYILKVISIPASRIQLDALLLSGAYSSENAAAAYFKELAQETVKEAEALQKLSKLDGFLSFEAWQIEPMEDQTGFDVYLLGSYRRTLEKQFLRNPLTHLGAVNLGLDLCAALTVCRHAGCLYVDLKPGNIFVTPEQNYRIGDLGLVSLSSLKYTSLPEKYRSSYTAPEIKDAYSSLNTTIDIYALGLILYQAYNNGKLPFEGEAPSDSLPPPEYADFEMAEIILKACSVNPEDRWQDPAEMGQALVGYLQRNVVNDTPIIPPTPEVPFEDPQLPADEPVNEEIPSAESAEEPTVLDDNMISDVDLSLLDENLPNEELDSSAKEEEMSDDLSEILAQADELLAQEVPDPVIAPEPIEVPMPEPISLEEPEEESAEVLEENNEQPAEEEAEETDIPDDAGEESLLEEETEPEEMPAKKKKRGWITVILVLLLLAGIAFGGYYYYQNYYRLEINDLQLVGSKDGLTVQIQTDIDESILTVHCIDTYGNSKIEKVSGGTATFTGLSASTQYRISVSVDGFHKLYGSTTANYTTTSKTQISNFSAVVGPADGSVILNFTADGPSPDLWTIGYSAEGEEEKSVEFTGHNVTISDLIPGKTYTFRILSEDDFYIDGSTEIQYTASNVLLAQNAKFISLEGTVVTLDWEAPSDMTAAGWTVVHYDDQDNIVESFTVDSAPLEIDVADLSRSHNFEIIADGMTQSVKVTLSADPVIITSILPDASNQPNLYLNWSFDGSAPEGGWLVHLYADGSELLDTLTSESNSVVLKELIPGAQYTIHFEAADNSTVFKDTFVFNAPDIQIFSGYWVNASNMEFDMCRRPDVEDWEKEDLSAEDYTSSFAPGEKASFLVYMNRSYDTSNDIIKALYVIRDTEGVPVVVSSHEQTWSSMWNNRYCELDIPELPSIPGTYTLGLYFNGKAVVSYNFEITE